MCSTIDNDILLGEGVVLSLLVSYTEYKDLSQGQRPTWLGSPSSIHPSAHPSIAMQNNMILLSYQVFVQVAYPTHLMCVLLSRRDCMHQVKTSPMKRNLVAKVVSNIELILCLTLWKSFSFFQIQGMSIGETLPQMIFCQKKAAKFVQMVRTSARAHKNGWLSTFPNLPAVFRSTRYGNSIWSINCSSLVQPLAHSNFFIFSLLY